jgi:hypothetical protein
MGDAGNKRLVLMRGLPGSGAFHFGELTDGIEMYSTE